MKNKNLNRFGSQENQRFSFEQWYASLTPQQKVDLEFNTKQLYVEDQRNWLMYVLGVLCGVAMVIGYVYGNG